MKTLAIISLSLTTGLLVGACDKSGGAGGSNNPASAASLGACPADANIEDGEDNDDQISKNNGRGGYLYTYLDETGTTVEPEEGSFVMAEEGANGTKHAMQIKGKTGDGEVYVGMGFNFTHPQKPFDASAYGGITFWAKKGGGTATTVRVKIPDTNTEPAGKICAECYNDFGMDIEVGDEWKQYTVSFEEMSQLPGWGNPRPNYIDKSQLFGIQWQVATPGVEFNILIDEVAFVGCE